MNPERFGRDAAALSALGGDIGDFGSRLMQARKRALENDAISTAHADDIEWITNTTQSLKLSYQKKDAQGQPVLGPSGDVLYDVDGFSKTLEEKMQERRKEQMAKMPTGEAQRGYYDATMRLYGGTYAEAVTWENMTKALTYKQNFEVLNNSQANLLINNPDLRVANESIESMRQGLERSIGNTNTPGEAQELYNRGVKTRILGLMNGYANNANTAREGLNVLNHITETAPRDSRTGELIMGEEQDYPEAGKQISKTTDASGKTTTVLSAGGMQKGIYGSGLDPRLIQQSLTANEIRSFRDRYESILKQKDHQTVADVRAWARDQKALLTSTDPRDFDRYSSAQTKLYLDQMKKLADTDVISRREFEDTVISVTLGRAYNVVRNEYAMMPPSSKAEFDNRLRQEYDAELQGMNIPSKSFAFDEVKDYRALNDRVWQHMMTERDKDIASYVEMNGQNRRGDVVNGIPSQDRFLWRVSQAENIEHRPQLWMKDEITAHVGWLKQMAESNPQQAAGQLWQLKERSGNFAGAAMDDLVNKGKLPGYFREAFYMDSQEVASTMIRNQEPKMKEALEKSVSGQTKKDLFAQVDAQFKATGAAFMGSGGERPANDLKEAVRLEATRIMGSDGSKSKDAVKQAMDEIVNSQYHVQGSAFIPKHIGGVVTNIDYIKGEMQAIYKPDVQARLGIDPPKSKDGKADRGMAIAMGRWMTNADNLGMTFKVPVGNSWTSVRTKDGAPVTIDFVKASVNPSQEALDYNKSWWETAFSGKKGVAQAATITPDAIKGDVAALEGTPLAPYSDPDIQAVVKDPAGVDAATRARAEKKLKAIKDSSRKGQ